MQNSESMRSRYYWICIFALPLLVTLMTMCGDKDTARISLTLEGAPDSTQVVVSRLALNEMQVLDTVYTSGGKTECRVTVNPGSPEFIYLTYGKDGVVSLLLQERDRVSVTAGWSEPSDVLIDGSDESALMQEVNDGIRTFNHRFDSLFAEISSAEAEENVGRSSALRRELGMLYVRRKQDALRYVLRHKGSMTVIPVLYQVAPNGQWIFSEATDALVMEQVYDTLHSIYPVSPYLAALADEIQSRRNIMDMGNILSDAEEVDFPEIVLADVNGEERSLTSLKGKVIVLYFWDPSVVEQRIFNVGLKEVYESYGSRGFEIYQVALTPDKTAWAMQVKEQELPWISVCDPSGASSTAAMMYNVSQLPAMFVISRDGEITARDLFETEMLGQEVRRLL